MGNNQGQKKRGKEHTYTQPRTAVGEEKLTKARAKCQGLGAADVTLWQKIA